MVRAKLPVRRPGRAVSPKAPEQHPVDMTKEEKARFQKFKTRGLGCDRGFVLEDLNAGKFPEYIAAVIKALTWEKFVLHPENDAVNSIVLEWYSKLRCSEPCHPAEVIIRGVRVAFSVEDINHFYGLPLVEDCAFRALRNKEDEKIRKQLLQDLCIKGAEWTMSAKGKYTVERTKLRKEAKVWYQFLRARLQPTSHIQTVSIERAMLLWCIIKKKPVDVARIILNAMWDCAKVDCGKLWFPGLITNLCINAAVDVDPQEKREQIKGAISYGAFTRMVNEAEEEEAEPAATDRKGKRKVGEEEQPKKKTKIAAGRPQSTKGIAGAKLVEQSASGQSPMGQQSSSSTQSAEEELHLKQHINRLDKDVQQLKKNMDVLTKGEAENKKLLQQILSQLKQNAPPQEQGNAKWFTEKLLMQDAELGQVKAAVQNIEGSLQQFVTYVRERDEVVNGNFTNQFIRFKPFPKFPSPAPPVSPPQRQPDSSEPTMAYQSTHEPTRAPTPQASLAKSPPVPTEKEQSPPPSTINKTAPTPEKSKSQDSFEKAMSFATPDTHKSATSKTPTTAKSKSPAEPSIAPSLRRSSRYKKAGPSRKQRASLPIHISDEDDEEEPTETEKEKSRGSREEDSRWKGMAWDYGRTRSESPEPVSSEDESSSYGKRIARHYNSGTEDSGSENPKSD